MGQLLENGYLQDGEVDGKITLRWTVRKYVIEVGVLN